MSSTLLLLLPARPRLRSQARGSTPEPRSEAPEYDYVFSSDGEHLSGQGRGTVTELPKAEVVIAVPAESDCSWHRVALPRAGGQRLRAALGGLLEEALLDDPEALHFAIEPDSSGGDSAWVCVTHKAWLLEHLSRLDQAQIFVDRVSPVAWPEHPPRGHFIQTGDASGQGSVKLHWSHPDGVAELSVDGGLARKLFAPGLVQATQWTAVPGAAAAAEHWLGTRVQIQSPQQRALLALSSPWDLRQFDLAARTRGLRALRVFWRSFMARPWRPVRQGLVALLVLQLLALNLAAWQQRHELQVKRRQMEQVLTDSFPKVRAVLDAPVQMRRETEALRLAAGRAGEEDLEALLGAFATAWPADRGPVDALSFESGRLSLPSAGWSDTQLQSLRSLLQSEGWQLENSEGRMSLSRARAAPPRP